MHCIPMDTDLKRLKDSSLTPQPNFTLSSTFTIRSMEKQSTKYSKKGDEITSPKL